MVGDLECAVLTGFARIPSGTRLWGHVLRRGEAGTCRPQIRFARAQVSISSRTWFEAESSVRSSIFMHTTESHAAGIGCESCGVANAPSARFCKSCGSSLRPPEKCPACGAAVPQDARFCSGCGSRLVGARADGPPASELQASLQTTPAPKSPESAQAIVEQLRQQKKGKSNIFGNVLLFVAVLLVFVVFMREWNKGRPKEETMFGGGGGAPTQGASAEAPAQPTAPAGPGVRGVVKLAPGLEAAGGTLFVMVRMAGSPDRGPPVAVKKIVAPALPVQFEVSSADVMMKGMPFTGPFDVYARLDRDGDPMTRDPDDLVVGSAATNAMAGGQPIDVVLDRRVRDVAAQPSAPPPPSAPAPSAAAPAGESIAGKVKIDPSVTAPAGARLFVIVRPSGSPERGPPLAVKPYDSVQFPVDFEVGPGDVMIQGMPFVGPFDVYARLDADGNAMTRDPGDLELSAPKSNVKPGERAIELVLDKRR
jgi:hypothetical protein